MSKVNELAGYALARPGGIKWTIPEKGIVSPEHLVCGPGTRVICANAQCRDLIGVMNSPLYSTMNIRHDQVTFQPHQVRKAGERAVCGRCGTTYMDHLDWLGLSRGRRQRGRTIRVHTEMGWI